MGEPEDAVEEWVALTQQTLGTLIAKPRMLTERLRKPPFRFLFDTVTEVTRQTGFGLVELFSGEIGEKPKPPSTREDKVVFLQNWVTAANAILGDRAADLTNVNPDDIVCGLEPEWTNYLLQCTAAAAWPSSCAPPVPPQPPQPPAQCEADAVPANAVPTNTTPADADVVQGAVQSAVVETAAVEDERVSRKAPPGPELEPMSIEKAKEIAATLDFKGCLDEFKELQEGFAYSDAKLTKAPEPLPSARDGWDDDDDDEEEPASMQQNDQVSSEGKGALKQAAMTTMKVNESIMQAQDLLSNIEAGLEQTQAEVQRKREREAQRLAEIEESKRREEEEERERAEQEARDAEERAAAKKAEKEAAKAAKKAQKEAQKEAARLAAEEEERQRAMEPKFPVSKTSFAQSARMVSCVGNDDYEWDGHDEGEDDTNEQKKAESDKASSKFPMSACLTDDLLESKPSKAFPLGTIGETDDFYGNPATSNNLFDKVKAQLKDTFVSYLCASMPSTLLKQYDPDDLIGCLQRLLSELRKCVGKHGLEDVQEEEPTSLAEDLRANFPNDWLSHVQCATPWSLRSKYDIPELVDTLQNLAQICFERLSDELGPITRWAGEGSPLLYVPPAEPEKVQPPPVSQSPAMPSRGPSPVQEKPAATTSKGPWTSELGSAPWEAPQKAPTTASGPWSSELRAAPWEEPSAPATASQLAPATAGPSRSFRGPSPTPGSFRGTSPSRRGTSPSRTGFRGPSPVPEARIGTGAPSRLKTATTGGGSAPAFNSSLGPAPWEAAPSTSAAATFNATLGPAPWETEASVPMPSTSQAMRMPTGTRMGTGTMTQSRNQALTSRAGFGAPR